jgi:hypothetical protein
LFPTLIFHFIFDQFNKLSAVLRVSGDYFKVLGLLFGKWFRGSGQVFRVELDLFENPKFEFLVLLVLNQFKLTLQESYLLFIPL